MRNGALFMAVQMKCNLEVFSDADMLLFPRAQHAMYMARTRSREMRRERKPVESMFFGCMCKRFCKV